MKRRPWSPEDEQLLRELYPNTPTQALADRFGREIRSVYAKAKAMGLAKSAEYLASPFAARLRAGDGRGKATRFKAGHTAWNKGQTYQPGGRAKETQFKPGNVPHSMKPIGSEKWRDGYLWRKVSDDQPVARFNWREVHRLLWEEHNGPIPEGHAVVFRNGDRTDIRIENLEIITRQELGRRNTVHRLPPELRKVIRTKGALTRRINKLMETTT